MSTKKATSALISVFHKDGLEPIVKKFQELGITIYSTGGTEKFIQELGINVVPVEEYLAAQGRFKHLFKDQYKHMIGEWQERVDANWAYLNKREEARV